MLVPERRLGLNKRKVATADTTVRFFSIRREYIEIKRTRGAQKSELKKKNNPTVYWTKRLAKRTVRERDRKKRGGESTLLTPLMPLNSHFKQVYVIHGRR